jgi:hypothetical protein
LAAGAVHGRDGIGRCGRQDHPLAGVALGIGVSNIVGCRIYTPLLGLHAAQGSVETEKSTGQPFNTFSTKNVS